MGWSGWLMRETVVIENAEQFVSDCPHYVAGTFAVLAADPERFTATCGERLTVVQTY